MRIQIYIAVSTYLFISTVKYDMQLDRCIYEILQILSISLTDKTKFQYDKDQFDFNGPNLFNV